MRQFLISGAFVAALLSGGDVIAVDLEVGKGTTNNWENSDKTCWDCELTWFHSTIECAYETRKRPAQPTDKAIDDCVGNENGQMVHGLGAGDSCKDYVLDNDELHAKCRNGAGVYVDTSFVLSDFFMLHRVVGEDYAYLTCAQ